MNGIYDRTSGTYLHDIPLPNSYRLKFPLPLEAVEHGDGAFVIECPAIDEYGIGKSYGEALQDLGQSIVDLHRVLIRRRHKGLDQWIEQT